MASREAMEQGQCSQGNGALGNTKQYAVSPNKNVGNGPQQGFATGATRSTSEGKIDYEGHINPDVLAIFGEYMHAHRRQRDGQLRSSDNWQEGIPCYRYVKSLIRHTWEFHRMWRGTVVQNPDSGSAFTFREVLCAMLFNTMGLLLEMSKKPGWLDMHCLPKSTRQFWEQEGTAAVALPGPIKAAEGMGSAGANFNEAEGHRTYGRSLVEDVRKATEEMEKQRRDIGSGAEDLSFFLLREPGAFIRIR